MSGSPRGRLVYSTGGGGAQGKPKAAGAVEALAPPERHDVRVRIERAGRSGKTVTVAGPFLIDRAQASELLAELKRHCGGGGTLEAMKPAGAPGHALVVQGDHVERVVAFLVARGYRSRGGG